MLQVDHPLSSGLNRTYSNSKTGKKSLASRISNQLGRFKRSSSADKSQSRIVNHVPNPPEHGFSPHMMRPRRTFYNVLPPRDMVRTSGSMRGPSSSRRYFVHPPVSASVTPSWAKDSSGGSNGPLYHHRPMCVDLDNTVAINGNVCLCEGLENGGGRMCRRCGLERQAVKAKVESWWKDWISDPSKAKKELIKRSQSEESVSTSNPYEAMRKQRLSASTNMAGRYVSGWNDDEPSSSESEAEGASEDEEDKARAYAEVDLIYNSVRRRPPPPPMHSMFQPSPYVIDQQHPPRLQRSSSSVIRRSIILKTPTSSKILPAPPSQRPNPGGSASTSATPVPPKSKATVYVAAEPQPNNTVVKINMSDDSSAKESSSDVEDMEDASGEASASNVNSPMINAAETDQNSKMKQLQLRNLKRLREKVKEEEEKLRALKSAAAKIKEASTNSNSLANSSSIGENEVDLGDDDYDADCSESSPAHKKLTASGGVIMGNNNTIVRNRPQSMMISGTSTPQAGPDSSKLMQLYHRRKRQQELQIRSEFNPGEMQLDSMVKDCMYKDNVSSIQGMLIISKKYAGRK